MYLFLGLFRMGYCCLRVVWRGDVPATHWCAVVNVKDVREHIAVDVCTQSHVRNLDSRAALVNIFPLCLLVVLLICLVQVVDRICSQRWTGLLEWLEVFSSYMRV